MKKLSDKINNSSKMPTKMCEDLLNVKNKRELEKMRANKRSDSIISIMEDFHSIILLGKHSVADVQKMLRCNNLLEELAIFWQYSEKVMALQEEVLEEFLSGK